MSGPSSQVAALLSQLAAASGAATGATLLVLGIPLEALLAALIGAALSYVARPPVVHTKIPVRLLGAVVRHWTLAFLPLLLASAVLNVWQWKRAVTAPLLAQNEALGAALTTARGLARDTSRDNARLVSELDALIERGRRTRVVYRHAAASAPLPPQCAPGAERIQAINQGLGPSEPIQRE